MKKYRILFKSITLERILNLIKIQLSFFISNILKKPYVLGVPYSISIEPNNYCNLKCPECPSGLRILKRENGNLTEELNTKIIDEIGQKLFHVFYYFQGEPFLHKNLLQLISYASNKKIYTATSTNGHFINKENSHDIINSGLSEIIISIDGTTQEIYEKYRIGGNLSTVIDSIKLLKKTKTDLKSLTPIITVQFLVTAENEHQIPEIKKTYKLIGADYLSLKSAQIYDFENGNPLIPRNTKYSRYKLDSSGHYKIKSKLKNKCSRLWETSVICWNGKVSPCCFDKDGELSQGDFNKNTFHEIWKSKSYYDIRKQILSNRKHLDICRNCTEGLK